ADIAALYQRSAPALWHRFEESEGATGFVDVTDTFADGTCTSCPQSEVKGQLGLAAAFSGASIIHTAT
ncbi:MAG: hypothetical protein KDE31_18400, partial [Caldilineaceae bacterium]|nr:hypothetical protein [Caldilineaceae bacterium]